jgi:hypothetical protein
MVRNPSSDLDIPNRPPQFQVLCKTDNVCPYGEKFSTLNTNPKIKAAPFSLRANYETTRAYCLMGASILSLF